MKIEKSIYQGYIWYSDQTKPEVINGEFDGIELNNNNNPFIIEGQLYDTVNKKSFSIKYVDGKYVVSDYDLADLNNVIKDEISYCAHRLDGVSKLKFYQYWREDEDPKCENMEVLQPAELVFVGFEKSKEE